MTGQGTGHDGPRPDAERAGGPGGAMAEPGAFVPATADRAPPVLASGGSGPTSPPVTTTDDILLIQRVEVGHAGPVQFGRAVVGMPRGAAEPYVLPPGGNLAFILGNKYVWRRFVISVLAVAVAILVVAVSLRVAGVHVDGLMTVGVTGAATAVSVTAYVGRLWAATRGQASRSTEPDAMTGDDGSA